MDLDLRLQRAFDRIELVSGAGDPRAGTMCVMSFAAFLAGEAAHTDDPVGASRLIRAFAIPINDAMPYAVRQRLKPFAPRIVGTNDGLDGVRAELLRRALTEEILPRASLRYRVAAAAPQPERGGVFRRLWSRLSRGEVERRIAWLLERAGTAAGRPGGEVQTARSAGLLLGLCARGAADAKEAEWYWNQAISVLDRLCDVGASQRRRLPGSGLSESRLDWLETTLGGGGRSGGFPAELWAPKVTGGGLR